jgi:cell division protein FtsI (penicillin-binding protein 3)
MLFRFFRARSRGPVPSTGELAAEQAVRRAAPAPASLDPLRHADRPDEQFELKWRGAMRGRVLLVLCGMALWAAGIEARLVHLQIVQHEEMLARAQRQQKREIKLTPARGDIVDRQGRLLAYSVDGNALVADPQDIDNPPAVAAQICRALGECDAGRKAALLGRLTRKGSFAYLERRVTNEQAERIDALKLAGIRIIPEPQRFYPKAELAAHVLGFVGVDNEGLGGVEQKYNDDIRGIDGQMLLQMDARRQRMDSRVQRAPTPGATVELTLDLYLQHIAERELQAGVDRFNASGGTAIVMDPHNGEILALASYPTFNPNAYQQFSADQKRDRAIQDVYEPGSTFKIVTASAALEERLFTVDELIDTNPGVITFPGRKPITEAKGHNYGVLSLQDAIVKSSNVGAIKIGARVGPERMDRFVRGFGFGQALLPDLAGQSRGIVWRPEHLNDSALASVSMGYQVSVTPLQMATAASVVANGGTLFQPHVVRAIIRDGVREPREIKPIRRVISADTAAKLTTIMEGVVGSEIGTAKAARVDGFDVAGKTGTAAKLINKQYSTSAYNVSFVGFVPSRAPVFTILVVIDTPRNGSAYGGVVAAPIFQRIADSALRHLVVPPTAATPPVVLASRVSSTTETVSGPAASPAIVSAGGTPIMPDVRGLSAREAVRVLSAAGLIVRLTGSGIVSTQTPGPGEPIETGDASVIELKRRAAEDGGAR